MDCRETGTLLVAFHDGELSDADRVRVGAHLAACAACRALLSGLSRADEAAGVPDPGPEYWDGFNARVMDRIEAQPAEPEAGAPRSVVLRPRHGWVRQQLRYLVPALAAAALVVVVVRYAGMEPGAPAPPVSGTSAPRLPGEPAPPRVPPDGRAASGMPARRADADRIAGKATESAAPPAYPAEAKATPAPPDEATVRAEMPEPTAAPPPAPAHVIGRLASAPPPDTAAFADGRSGGIAGQERESEAVLTAAGKMQADRSEPAAAGAASPPPAQAMRWAAKAESAAESRSAKERPGSPCELARKLAAQGRLKEAEAAQRACLERDRSAATQEAGLVFLAELLDRQARFAEADAVILDTQRQFPASRPLDRYMQQRPTLQQLQRLPAR